MQKLLSWFDTLTWTDSTNSNLTAHDIWDERINQWYPDDAPTALIQIGEPSIPLETKKYMYLSFPITFHCPHGIEQETIKEYLTQFKVNANCNAQTWTDGRKEYEFLIMADNCTNSSTIGYLMAYIPFGTRDESFLAQRLYDNYVLRGRRQKKYQNQCEKVGYVTCAIGSSLWIANTIKRNPQYLHARSRHELALGCSLIVFFAATAAALSVGATFEAWGGQHAMQNYHKILNERPNMNQDTNDQDHDDN